MKIITYRDWTDKSGVEHRKFLNTVSSKDEAFWDCLYWARWAAHGVDQEKWYVNLVMSSQFEWCTALQQIDKKTGETLNATWGYEIRTCTCGYEEAAHTKTG